MDKNLHSYIGKYGEFLQKPELRAEANLEGFCAFVIGGILTHIFNPSAFKNSSQGLDRFQLQIINLGRRFQGEKAPASFAEQGESLVAKLEEQRLIERAFALCYTLKIAFQTLDDTDQTLHCAQKCVQLYNSLSPVGKQNCAMDYHTAQGTAESLTALARAKERAALVPGETPSTAAYKSLHKDLSEMNDALVADVWEHPYHGVRPSVD
jgi:hypothetical protein